MELLISKEDLIEYEKLKIISKIAPIKEKIKFFEKKYKCSFEEFEKKISEKNKEKFEEWDDYIEWKAYVESLKDLEGKLKEVENVGNIRIA